MEDEGYKKIGAEEAIKMLQNDENNKTKKNEKKNKKKMTPEEQEKISNSKIENSKEGLSTVKKQVKKMSDDIFFILIVILLFVSLFTGMMIEKGEYTYSFFGIVITMLVARIVNNIPRDKQIEGIKSTIEILGESVIKNFNRGRK